MNKILNILAIGAHPDDIELLMMGTLIRYKEQGHKVYTVIVTDGRKGIQLDGDTVAEIRKKEAITAAAHINITPIFLGLEDTKIIYEKIICDSILDIIKQVNPDVIFTHDPNDYHSDHRIVSNLVLDEADRYAIPVFFSDILTGVGFNPQFYVDITNQYNLKKVIISEHKSQLFTKILDVVELQNKFRGIQYNWGINVKYAEAFRILPRSHFVNAYKLLPDENF
jgi:N-acetylglucosamine malate deacetylase 1